MKFGMNLLLWTDDPTQDSFLPVLKNLKKMGFDGVELPIFNMDVERWENLGKELDRLGLERTAVTVRGVDDNPISSDPAVREKGIALNKQVLDICKVVGATHLAGPYYAALGHFSGSGPTQEEWQWGVESMKPVAEYAGELGITLVPEFLNRFEIYLLNNAADAAKFVREVNHPACKMMYDTFHANIEEKNITAALKSCADVMGHVHISENDRSTPGKGQVNWQETFDALKKIKYDGWLTIEAFGLSLPALAAATKIWRRMFDSEEQLAKDGLKFMKKEFAKRWAKTAGKKKVAGKKKAAKKVTGKKKAVGKMKAAGKKKAVGKMKAAGKKKAAKKSKKK
jgi:D-psicose/D-tagatose/L-ribulose 3-epimerase